MRHRVRRTARSPWWAARVPARRPSQRRLLFRAGAIPRRGAIEQGTTVCDHDPEEIARQTSLGISLAYLTWNRPDGGESEITLIDTPGHPDFVGGVDTALAVADVAAVVVSAVDGVTPGTRRVWAAAQEAGVPCIVIVTQEDRARADFRRVLAELRATFGDHLWPLELPLGEEQDFHAVADLLGEHALVYDESGHHREEPLPAAAEAEEHDLHVSVTEEIVAHDDAQLEAYLEGNEPSADELERTFAHEVASGEAVPVLLCSGLTGTGVDRIADLLCSLSPAARDHDSRIVVGTTADGDAGTEVRVAPNPDGETVVHVFRTVADPFVGQIAMLKVLSGTLRPSDRLRNATTGRGGADPGAVPTARRSAPAGRCPSHRRGRRGGQARGLAVGIAAVVAAARRRATRSAAAPASGLRRQPRPGDPVR